MLGVSASRMRLGVSFVAALPADNQVRVAAEAAAAGFAPGIVSPTELFLQGGSVGSDPDKLARLGREIEQQPGVAGVVSPGALPERLARGALVTEDGQAARFAIVLDHGPLGAAAISDLDDLSEAMPALLRRSGLEGVRYGLGGDTALAGELVVLYLTEASTRTRVTFAHAAARVGAAVVVVGPAERTSSFRNPC